ncbi:MAG: A/G-specific adenine glycosylase [Bacteroidota bacterium]|nr:A/G-specific adenine glycosylase [Bacteroidota bacterium]
MQHFSNKIIRWYDSNKRDLPWRNTKDPYFIWLSEIIMQQTRVDQGMAYYNKFASEFPTVKHLAKADNEKVMKLWQGLGYYSRARNLHETAKIISSQYKGKFPASYQEILALKGIGDYTAAAISSFAFDLPHAVVDGNVYRVLSRVFGIHTPIDSSAGKKEFSVLANELISKKDPASHNQAVMELGALQCKPQNPECSTCVLNSMCFAYSKKSVDQFPVKSKKTKVRDRFFNYAVLRHNGKIAINKRTEKDIWTNLYDFPLIETPTNFTEDELFSSAEWKGLMGKNKFQIRSVHEGFKHILSHQKIYARFVEVDFISSFKDQLSDTSIMVSEKDLKKYAVPRLIDLFLEKIS